MTDQERLLEGTLSLAEQVAEAESAASVALQKVAMLRQRHLTQFLKWQKTRASDPNTHLDSPGSKLERAVLGIPAPLIDEDTAVNAVTERHDIVVSALERAVATSRSVRINIPQSETDD